MDHRDRAAVAGKWYERFDEKTMTATIWDEEGGPDEVKVPCIFEVCPTCQGKGSHVNPSIDAHGITGEEWERDWDDEERESYLSGGYDVTCAECDGARVVPVPDADHLSKEAKAALDGAYEAQRERVADYRTQLAESGVC